MDFDALLLSRIQFAFTIAFHIIFPSFTIGLASYLAVLEGLWLTTRNETFKTLYLFWVKVFAISFGMGVVSGVVMSYQLGTNWSVFSAVAGPVIGPLFAFEVLAAFFLEASFLGVMLFGWKKVGPGLHFASTVLVAFGTLTSAFWIISANSWMQSPAGFAGTVEEGLVAVNWLQVIFSPTFPERLAHALGAGHRIVCLDLPGNGQLHAQRSPARVDAMVDAARQQLRERDIHGPLRLVALSLGGMVAVQWLCNHPREIEAVALINSSAARFSPFWKRLRPANYPSIVCQGLLGRNRLRREQMILRISTDLLDPERRQRLAERFTEVDRLRPVSAANTVRQLWAALRFRAPVALPPAARLLVINGAGDRLVHPDCSRDLARHWQRPLLAHPRGGHDLSLDAPDWLARTLARWWTEQGEMSPVDRRERQA